MRHAKKFPKIILQGGTDRCSCMGAYWLLEALYRMATYTGSTFLSIRSRNQLLIFILCLFKRLISRSCLCVAESAADAALEVLTANKKNSWLNMIKQGGELTSPSPLRSAFV